MRCTSARQASRGDLLCCNHQPSYVLNCLASGRGCGASTRHSRRAHDDTAAVTLGDVIGHESGLDVFVVETLTALGAEALPVAVVVTMAVGAAGGVADLAGMRAEKGPGYKKIGKRRGKAERDRSQFHVYEMPINICRRYALALSQLLRRNQYLGQPI